MTGSLIKIDNVGGSLLGVDIELLSLCCPIREREGAKRLAQLQQCVSRVLNRRSLRQRERRWVADEESGGGIKAGGAADFTVGAQDRGGWWCRR